MTLKLIKRLTPLVVGKFLYSQIHDWSGNGGGKLPYHYRTKKYKNFGKSEKNEKSEIWKKDLWKK